jgi:serine/threonine protein kinase
MNDFRVVSKLGEGSYISVFKVKRKNDPKFYAMKKVFEYYYLSNRLDLRMNRRGTTKREKKSRGR